VCTPIGQVEVAKGHGKRLTYSAVAVVAARLPSASHQHHHANDFERPADLRCGGAAGPDWGMLHANEPAFQTLAPIERLANLGIVVVTLMHVAPL
jgi:hypothetical protein